MINVHGKTTLETPKTHLVQWLDDLDQHSDINWSWFLTQNILRAKNNFN